MSLEEIGSESVQVTLRHCLEYVNNVLPIWVPRALQSVLLSLLPTKRSTLIAESVAKQEKHLIAEYLATFILSFLKPSSKSNIVTSTNTSIITMIKSIAYWELLGPFLLFTGKHAIVQCYWFKPESIFTAVITHNLSVLCSSLVKTLLFSLAKIIVQSFYFSQQEFLDFLGIRLGWA